MAFPNPPWQSTQEREREREKERERRCGGDGGGATLGHTMSALHNQATDREKRSSKQTKGTTIRSLMAARLHDGGLGGDGSTATCPFMTAKRERLSKRARE